VILDKFPLIVKSVNEFREGYVRAGELYFGMCSAVREAKLEKKDSTLVLLALGLSKSRTSEVIRVSSVPDAIWSQYAAGSVGFKATLALGKDKPQVVGPEAGQTGGDPGQNPPKAPRKVAKIRDLTEKAQEALKKVLRNIGKHDGESPTEYALSVRIEELNYYVAITVTDKNA